MNDYITFKKAISKGCHFCGRTRLEVSNPTESISYYNKGKFIKRFSVPASRRIFCPHCNSHPYSEVMDTKKMNARSGLFTEDKE